MTVFSQAMKWVQTHQQTTAQCGGLIETRNSLDRVPPPAPPGHGPSFQSQNTIGPRFSPRSGGSRVAGFTPIPRVSRPSRVGANAVQTDTHNNSKSTEGNKTKGGVRMRMYGHELVCGCWCSKSVTVQWRRFPPALPPQAVYEGEVHNTHGKDAMNEHDFWTERIGFLCSEGPPWEDGNNKHIQGGIGWGTPWPGAGCNNWENFWRFAP